MLEPVTGVKGELIAGGEDVLVGGEERLEQLFQGKEDTTIADPTRVTRLAKYAVIQATETLIMRS